MATKNKIDILPKLCGYGDGWCKVTPLSWWECEKVSTSVRSCRYFTAYHPSFPMIVMDHSRQLILDTRKIRYDDRYSHIISFDEAEPAIIKVDEEGKCDFCKLPTHFWDINISVYICSKNCRKAEYNKLEKENG